MKLGAAHVDGLYTVPNGSGTQFSDGCDAIWNLGLRTIKLYLTADYATDYTLQSSWSATPTTLTTLAQTTQFATQLARAWDTVFLTTFTFANGTTNWWRADVAASKLSAEYTEIYNLAVHLLTTYAGTGRRFVLQTWEGDWALMDSTVVTTVVDPKFVDRYAAFLGVRQKAVEDARKASPSDVQVLNAVEVNRVLDSVANPDRKRILRHLAGRIRPDMVSWSAYDGTIVDQGGWGASQAAWEAATVPVIRKAFAAIKAAFPGVPLYVGEFGFPEEEVPGDHSIAQMLNTCLYEFECAGVDTALFWQVFDNEQGGGGEGTYRGYWMKKPNGDVSASGLAIQDWAT